MTKGIDSLQKAERDFERKRAAATVKEAEDKWKNAREQAQAQFESIKEMVEAFNKANEAGDNDATDAAVCEINFDALSVEVRSDWVPVGAQQVDRPMQPVEYRILLCTGGPAVQIAGHLDEHGEPETARLEMQDWFLPWTEYRPTNEHDHTFTTRIDTKAEAILLAYARQFYFGE